MDLIWGSTYVCFSSVWKCFDCDCHGIGEVRWRMGSCQLRQEMKLSEMGKLRTGGFFVREMVIAYGHLPFHGWEAGCKDSVKMPGLLREEHLGSTLERAYIWVTQLWEQGLKLNKNASGLPGHFISH